MAHRARVHLEGREPLGLDQVAQARGPAGWHQTGPQLRPLARERGQRAIAADAFQRARGR